MKKTILIALSIALALTFTTCKDDDNVVGDLQKWTEASNCPFGDGSGDINAIAYGNAGNKFVAVGVSCEIAYSVNGTSWTAAADSTFDTSSYDSIRAIAYGSAGNRFVAVGYEGSSYLNYTGRMTYSDDNGVTWTRVSDSKFGTDTISAIAYGNGRWIAGGQNGKMAYSANGESWTAVADSTFTAYIWGIAYGGGKFVAGGNNGKMAYSADGESWTTVADSTFTNTIYSIAYGNGRFVAVGDDGRMAYSQDGLIWTAVEDSTIWDDSNGIYTAPVGIQGIAYGNGMFVAVGSAGKMAYSADGASWTAVSNSTTNFRGIAYGIADGASLGRFVAVGYDGKIAYADW